MNRLDAVSFESLLERSNIKPKFYKDVRLAPLPANEWHERELVAAPDRSQNQGILLLSTDDKLFATPYRISRQIIDKRSGRTKSITCDFCYTWQAGHNGAHIIFTRQSDKHSLGFLCCADLACSQHVRDKTSEALKSRVHLHEDLTSERRVARLTSNLGRLVQDLRLRPIEDNEEVS